MSRFVIRTLIGPRGWSAYLHFYYKKIVAQTMAVVCTTNLSMFVHPNVVCVKAGQDAAPGSTSQTMLEWPAAILRLFAPVVRSLTRSVPLSFYRARTLAFIP